jgi:nicotinamidase-related amidase
MKRARSILEFCLTLAIISVVSACGGERREIPKSSASALMVIDCQRDYLQAHGRMPVAQDQVAAMIKAVNSTIAAARKQAIPVIYTMNEFAPWDFIGNAKRNHAAARYTSGQTFDPRIDDTAGVYFTKDHHDAFSNKEVESHLAIIETSQLVFAGVYAESAVLDTAKQALKMGYKVTVISDAVAGASDAAREKALNELKSAGAEIKSSSEFISGFGASA